mmetsp:Transcript_7059/g.12709  ORF Transcript_7059/g.12709 Transcript_7059/m.12709 type:complete len:189 (+) Transcript_7059:201-767(+)|eukprot:CAMPEP_0184706226 /NCGR_PEP_ID=MMETSP0313-20130426/36650_1 /TAXON_ID=2792 /ORGANISM="Porphyridium aerugineum, Strain SAG 1380-2" /LENGTH=188 /DNA_ID=CAMNT_0027167775 /DNA_START=729 /DNA_END=1295 /DNA_ORIENTATION=-
MNRSSSTGFGRSSSGVNRSSSNRSQEAAHEDDVDFEAPYEPNEIPGDKDVVKRYCQSPVNGRLEWIQAEVHPHNLHAGEDITEEMEDYVFETVEMTDRDNVEMIIHKSLGGKGSVFWNVFPQGSTFDREKYNDAVESTVFHSVKSSGKPAVITIKFVFKSPSHTKPYKVLYRVETSDGQFIEDDVLNA